MNDLINFRKDGYLISTDRATLDLDYIHDYLSNQSYWASGIPLETVKKSIEGSFCFGMFDQKKQIGFARVITDYATYGYLADVFIDEQYRKQGLSKWMMEVILSHPDLQGFRRWMLGTRDAHSLYAKFGFGPLENPERVMQKHNPMVYSPASS
jgi:GNAT superfamily N-acetyltransferase